VKFPVFAGVYFCQQEGIYKSLIEILAAGIVWVSSLVLKLEPYLSTSITFALPLSFLHYEGSS
jgi:hypothetical protein